MSAATPRSWARGEYPCQSSGLKTAGFWRTPRRSPEAAGSCFGPSQSVTSWGRHKRFLGRWQPSRDRERISVGKTPRAQAGIGDKKEGKRVRKILIPLAVVA